jgi:hypothetical protein
MRYFFRICQQSEFFHAQKGHVFYLLLFSAADAMSAFLIHFVYFMIILAVIIEIPKQQQRSVSAFMLVLLVIQIPGNF